jgi:hypothetical protein
MVAIRVNAAVIWSAHGQVAEMRSRRRRCPRTSRYTPPEVIRHLTRIHARMACGQARHAKLASK